MRKYDDLEFNHIHILQIKPVPEELNLFQYKKIITVEDGSIIGGMGHYLKSQFEDKTSAKGMHLGRPERLIPHGSNADW